VFYVDNSVPQFLNNQYGFYHPTTGERYIGSFSIDENGNSISNVLIIGYTGQGISSSPENDDRRVVIDNDEVRIEIYSNGAWSTTNGIRLGGSDSTGSFLAFLQASGVINQGVDRDSVTSPPPVDEYYIWNFNNVTTDRGGNDYWDTETSVAYTANAKFGTHALEAILASSQSNLINTTPPTNWWVAGNDFTVGFWVRAGIDPAQTSTEILTLGYETASPVYEFAISIGKTQVSLIIRENSSNVLQIDIQRNNDDRWHYVSFGYDNTSDDVYLTYDNNFVVGNYGITDTSYYKFEVNSANVQVDYIYIDELIFAYNNYIPYDTMIEHYQSNSNWGDTFYSGQDVYFKPATGGQIVSDGDHKFTGATEDWITTDAGSASATEQDWIEVTVGGTTGYIRVYATK
jgi:hypothetical protein